MSCTLSSSDDGCTVTRDCSATDSQGTNTINEVFVVNADKKGAVDTQTVKIVDSKGGVNADCTITTTFTKQ
jgi:hypothetical protein